jgi:uncharacterized membrane protein
MGTPRVLQTPVTWRAEGLPWPALSRRSALVSGFVAAAGFVGAFTYLRHGILSHHQLLDTPLYQAYGDATRVGDIPYLNFRVEYPPGALLAFLAPELTATTNRFSTYNLAFEWWMAAWGAILACLVVVGLRLLRAGRRHVSRALALVVASPLLLGPVMLSRFDLLPAALTVAALTLLLAGRDRFGFAVLALGATVKLYPLVCLVPALIWVARRKGLREAAFCTTTIVAVSAAVFVPFLVLSPQGIAHSFAVQLGRPLQIESLAAAVLVAAHHLGGVQLVLHEDHGSRNIEGSIGTLGGTVSTALQLALMATVYLLFALGPVTRQRLVTAFAASVTVFVAFGKVFSPQYMIWLLPLVVLVAGVPGLVATALAAVALLLTQLWFPDRYGQYADHLRWLESTLVLTRDLTVVGLAAVLIYALAARARVSLPSRVRLRAGPPVSAGTG